MESLKVIDRDVLGEARSTDQPYPHIVIPQLIRDEFRKEVVDGFPSLPGRGSFPIDAVSADGKFNALADELQSDEFRVLVGEAFGMDLSERVPMLTVRGFTDKKDGRIHTDSKAKCVTVLIYLNDEWTSDDGRLRLLNGPDDLEDHFAEVPPTFGSCVMFAVTDNCWHGHKAFIGERRALQLNYVTGTSAFRSHMWRHRLTAAAKGLAAAVRRPAQ